MSQKEKYREEKVEKVRVIVSNQFEAFPLEGCELLFAVTKVHLKGLTADDFSFVFFNTRYLDYLCLRSKPLQRPRGGILLT